MSALIWALYFVCIYKMVSAGGLNWHFFLFFFFAMDMWINTGSIALFWCIVCTDWCMYWTVYLHLNICKICQKHRIWNMRLFRCSHAAHWVRWCLSITAAKRVQRDGVVRRTNVKILGGMVGLGPVFGIPPASQQLVFLKTCRKPTSLVCTSLDNSWTSKWGLMGKLSDDGKSSFGEKRHFIILLVWEKKHCSDSIFVWAQWLCAPWSQT